MMKFSETRLLQNSTIWAFVNEKQPNKMASRRSRLQIKPNIGGPKLPAAKPSAKTTDPKLAKGDNSASPARSPSPRKGVGISLIKSTQKPNGSLKKNVGLVSPSRVKLNRSPRKSVDTSERDDRNIERTENENDIEQSTAIENPSIVAPNASINRFTKLIPRVVKDETAKNSITKTIHQEIGNDINTKQEDTESTGISENKEDGSEIGLKEEQQSNMAKSTTLPRRSRFPKAKPNVIDANKKRQRNSIVQASRTPAKSSTVTLEQQKESPLKRKAIDEVKIMNEDEIITEKTVEVVDGRLVSEPESPGTPQPFIPPKSPVKSTSANFNHLRLPVKAPIPTFSPIASPAKDSQGSATRARLLSTSEAPVIKKPRRTKIDIPTDKPPDRATMKMRDLIHWNPSSNPMKVKSKPEVKINNVGEEKENKKMKDKMTNQIQNKAVENSQDTSSQSIDVEDEPDSAMPVPQVTIGPDGNIVINEKSLVVENENLDKSLSQDDEVIDETDHTTTYRSFRDRKRAKRWTKKETTKFFKALAMIGADFFLIQKVFPKRSREEIKRKFKKEEKQNSRLVEMVLKEGIHFDRSFIENGENEESSDEEKVKEKQKDKPKLEKEKKEKKRRGRKPKSQNKQATTLESIYDKLSDEEMQEAENSVQIANYKDDVDWQPPAGTNNPSIDTAKYRKPLERKAKLMATNPDILIATPVNLEPQLEPKIEPKVIKLPIINRLAKANDISDHNTSLPELNPNMSYTDNLTSESVDAGGYSNYTSQVADSSNVELLSVPILSEPTTIPAKQNSSNYQNSTMLNSPEKQQTMENPHASSQALPMMSFVNNSAVDDNGPLMIPPQDLMQFQTGPDSTDQYVLVTVVPDGSEETVIHIYKVPAGAGSVQFPGDT